MDGYSFKDENETPGMGFLPLPGDEQEENQEENRGESFADGQQSMEGEEYGDGGEAMVGENELYRLKEVMPGEIRDVFVPLGMENYYGAPISEMKKGETDVTAQELNEMPDVASGPPLIQQPEGQNSPLNVLDPMLFNILFSSAPPPTENLRKMANYNVKIEKPIGWTADGEVVKIPSTQQKALPITFMSGSPAAMFLGIKPTGLDLDSDLGRNKVLWDQKQPPKEGIPKDPPK